MSKLFQCTLTAVVLGFTSPAWGDDAKEDADKLQGTWQATEGMSEGKPVPKEQLQGIKLVFSGEQMSLFPPDGKGKKTVEYTFRVDPGKKPKAIDLIRREGGSKGKIARAIYELDGDTLKLCLTNRLDRDRPTEFAAPEKAGLTLLTLKRVKK